jgi:hypothetical protein
MKYVLAFVFLFVIALVFWVPICLITWKWDDNGSDELGEAVFKLFGIDPW